MPIRSAARMAPWAAVQRTPPPAACHGAGRRSRTWPRADYSFAAGRRAMANDDGCFAWADSTNADFSCNTANQFAVRATGGVSLTVDTAGGGLRIQPDATSPNLIGGYSGNTVTAGAYGATIGGGGNGTYRNRVTDNYGTVGGGQRQPGRRRCRHHERLPVCHGRRGLPQHRQWHVMPRSAGAMSTPPAARVATVGGGYANAASGSVCHGRRGLSTTPPAAEYATVGGGDSNTASGDYATVGGGRATPPAASAPRSAGAYTATRTPAGQTLVPRSAGAITTTPAARCHGRRGLRQHRQRL